MERKQEASVAWPAIVEIMDSQKIITTTFSDRIRQSRYKRHCSWPTVKERWICDALGLKHRPSPEKKA